MGKLLRALLIIWIARYATLALVILTFAWLFHFLDRHL